jgi:hypothetical protein
MGKPAGCFASRLDQQNQISLSFVRQVQTALPYTLDRIEKRSSKKHDAFVEFTLTTSTSIARSSLSFDLLQDDAIKQNNKKWHKKNLI